MSEGSHPAPLVPREQLSDAVVEAAFTELAHLHAEVGKLAASLNRLRLPARTRARRTLGRVYRALRKTLKQGARVHRYPATFIKVLKEKPPRSPLEKRQAAARRLTVTRRLTELAQQGDYDRAVALAVAALPALSRDRRFTQEALQVLSKSGSVSLAFAATAALRQVDSSPAIATQEAFVAGRLRETTPGWRPALPGAAEPIQEPRPGRVLHILKESIPYHQNGFTMRSMYTLRAQVEAGLEPIVLTSLGFPRNVGIDDFDDEDVIDDVRHIRLDLGPGYDRKAPYDRYLTDFAWAAAHHVRELAPSVIHVGSGHRGYETALVGLELGRHFNIPVVYEVRSFFESTWTPEAAWAERGEYYQRRYETENRCMAAADAVITISESMRNEIISRGVPAERVSVAPNGVDTRQFQPRERSPELVERYGLAGRFTFGYVSNLDHPREGQEALIEAAALLREWGVPATALLIGDGRRRSELESLAAELTTDDAVIFTGRVDHSEVLDHYALLDVFVVPRTRDRAARLVTPLKPFEAMAAGIPLVTSDLEALREIIGDGQRGWLYPPGDNRALATLLQDLYHDPEARKAKADAAATWVAENRQWSANGPLYAAVYKEALARHESTI